MAVPAVALIALEERVKAGAKSGPANARIVRIGFELFRVGFPGSRPEIAHLKSHPAFPL